MRRGRLILASSLLLLSANLASAQCTVPNTIVDGTIIDAAPVAADFNAVATCAGQLGSAGAQNAVQITGTGGAFNAVGPLSSGQVLIGSSSGTPVAATLSAGPGISITNGAGAITISASGTPAGGGADWLNGNAVVAPNASAFTLRTGSTTPTGAAISATTRGMMLAATSATSSFTAMMAEVPLPSGPWQATMLSLYTGPLSTYTNTGIAVRDSVNARSVQFGMGAMSSTSYRFDYQTTSGGAGLNSYQNDTALVDPGLPLPNEPIWSRLTYDGTKLTWSFSRDGEFYVTGFSVAANAFLTNLNTIGPVVFFNQTARPSWIPTMHILSWKVVSL
ncbi:hypothetical protein [Rhizobium sp. C4]|uniref:hypothetical protein n=1 Tax=Rhizobium sp. C4 TaxID=1349800 RepID=UPI001E3AA97F|nr:hypothetical protein [Rhizobium sp. C4]MCD2175034.1 hypothetical protein [Rhizobium sp. C4]